MNRKTLSVIVFIVLALIARFANQSFQSKNTTHPPKTHGQPVQVPPSAEKPTHAPFPEGEKQWSDTQPRINLTHLFHGEINKKGKPVGFHARPEGQDPTDAGLIEVKDTANMSGVYTAQIWVRDQNKTKFSSIFPDRLSWQEVIQAVLYAYEHRTSGENLKWRGPSGLGFTIEGWLLENGDINTAYPIYKNNN